MTQYTKEQAQDIITAAGKKRHARMQEEIEQVTALQRQATVLFEPILAFWEIAKDLPTSDGRVGVGSVLLGKGSLFLNLRTGFRLEARYRLGMESWLVVRTSADESWKAVSSPGDAIQALAEELSKFYRPNP